MDIEIFQPGEFEPERHFYPRTLNAQIHPLVTTFFHMPIQQLVSRYCHLHPYVSRTTLSEILTTEPRYLRWSGSDIFNVSTETGVKQKLIVETNSCPSGQKSFPRFEEDQDEGGYWSLIKSTFLPLVSKTLRKASKETPHGIVAVLYDKNQMESSGYAQVLATLIDRPVYLIPCPRSAPRAFTEIQDRWLYAHIGGRTVPVICGFRYVTQRPWDRLPFNLKTPLLNPIVACLAGGRNKTSASKAYEMFNGQYRAHGLEILSPESFTNVRKAEVPLLVQQLGGRAVVKVPYLNAGQGIYTIVNDDELAAFMDRDYPYDEFIIQQLVGNYRWSSTSSRGKVFNIGTVPDKKDRIYIFDLRVMVSWQGESYAPVAMYARRAPIAMEADLQPGTDSWMVLGTNLSLKVGEEKWDTEPRRLLMMDRKDFGKLGMGLDDLIEAFVQAVLANRAIDDLARKLVKRGGGFRSDLFRSLNHDEALLNEIKSASRLS
ncbi:MAG: hypothetical protein MJE77_07425 [Proteobacteria bacterium]|nr:hypothetical protein [Pseudomonadota bacterium]